MLKKRIAVFFTALCAVFALCACEKVEDMGTLPDISKPYVGEYVLERLMLGDRDFTDRFDEAKLSLTYEGKFKLTYREKDGQSGEYTGDYSVSTEREEITFSSQTGLRTVPRTFPIKNGAIFIDLKLGTKLLHAEFSFPD